MIQQIADQPQIERVDLGDEALIGQIVAARAVGVVEADEAVVGQFFVELGAFEV